MILVQHNTLTIRYIHTKLYKGVLGYICGKFEFVVINIQVVKPFGFKHKTCVVQPFVIRYLKFVGLMKNKFFLKMAEKPL